MSLSKIEADEALKSVDVSQQLSRRLAGYERTAPQLIWWGALWAAGFALEYFESGWVNVIWPVIGTVGFLGSILLARRDGQRSDWRIGAAVWIILLFLIALFAVLGPTKPEQIAATWGLVIAAAYAMVGLMLGGRLLVIAACLAVATLVGYFFLGRYFLLWMSAFAGGSLILAGLWLRKV
jgi:hypothetical protein